MRLRTIRCIISLLRKIRPGRRVTGSVEVQVHKRARASTEPGLARFAWPSSHKIIDHPIPSTIHPAFHPSLSEF